MLIFFQPFFSSWCCCDSLTSLGQEMSLRSFAWAENKAAPESGIFSSHLLPSPPPPPITSLSMSRHKNISLYTWKGKKDCMCVKEREKEREQKCHACVCVREREGQMTITTDWHTHPSNHCRKTERCKVIFQEPILFLQNSFYFLGHFRMPTSTQKNINPFKSITILNNHKIPSPTFIPDSHSNQELMHRHIV